MKRSHGIAVVVLAATILNGCGGTPRLGSTWDLRTELTVEEGLWAARHQDAIEVAIVQHIQTIDPSEIYRATIIDENLAPHLPWQMLADSIAMEVTTLDVREHLPQPDALMAINVSIQRFGEDRIRSLKETEPQVIAWRAFQERFHEEVNRVHWLMTRSLRGGPRWVSALPGPGPQQPYSPGFLPPVE